MGYKLRREVRSVLPPGLLTAAERLLVLELADLCGDDTRECWPGSAKLAELTDLSERSIQETMSRIARKWIEIRVPLGEKNGKTVFAYSGRRTTYRFPKFPTEGTTDPGALGAMDPGASQANGAMDPEERCDVSVEKVRQIRGPSPSRISSKSNHSSLSPREELSGVATASPLDSSDLGERDGSTSSEQPKPPTPIHRLLLDAGCPEERLTDAERWITEQCQPRTFGWWRTTAGNGDLKVHVAAFLDAGPAATVCPDCNGTGETGDWMNRRACHCLWWTDPARARKSWVPMLKDMPPCDHGINGGNEKAPNGWQFCAECRGPGWVDRDVQPRTGNRGGTGGRSASVAAANQALRVAAELRDESPADRVVRNAQPPYDKYRGQEAGARISPNGYHHLTDSRHPNRDYTEKL